MPHRAGYFVLAYSWDHHCRVLFDRIDGKFSEAEAAARELRGDRPETTEALLDYYSRWHGASRLYHLAMDETRSRRYVLNSLGYRGYGVNYDLLRALADIEARYGGLGAELARLFSAKLAAVAERAPVPEDGAGAPKPEAVIAVLAEALGRGAEGAPAGPAGGPPGGLDRYFEVMAGQTPWQINTAIFQKMFLSVGVSSMTLMKGSPGLHGSLPEPELKLLANRNFVETTRRLFSTLHTFTDIGTDLLRRIHYGLSKDVHADAGSFRSIDFPDRNGVTFEFANFQREVGDLGIVLKETAESFHDLHRFIYNLARSYYMFIGIHPFWDANGRVGRCFLNLLLVKKGLPPVTMDDREEVLSLPRYGGSMEDMHRYLRSRLAAAIDVYFYERWKLQSFGLFGRRIHNVAFDSGFHFRQIGESRVEVDFEAHLCGDASLRELLAERSVVVFPDEAALREMTIYYGFCDGPYGEWRGRSFLRQNFYVKELSPAMEGVRTFDVAFLVDLPGVDGDYLAVSVTGADGALIFNNKGLNYSYRLERRGA